MKKRDGNEENVAKRANRGRQKEREREEELSLRMEFPLLFDLPTHAFCFPTADVALKIKDFKHTPRARVGGIVSSLVFPRRHGFFSPLLSSTSLSSFPNRL